MHQGFLDHHEEVLGFALECVVALVLFSLLTFQPSPVEHGHTLCFCLQVAIVGHCIVQVVEQELGLELEPEVETELELEPGLLEPEPQLELELELELPPSEVGPCVQQVPQCQGWQVILGCFVEVQVCLPLVQHWVGDDGHHHPGPLVHGDGLELGPPTVPQQQEHSMAQTLLQRLFQIHQK
jgi:hypothetical protein